jgi:hypothetical protein
MSMLPLSTREVTFAAMREPFSVLDISMAMPVSLGCVLGSKLPNVIVLKKYQYASWDRYFRVSALVVPNFMILSDRLVTMILLLLWTLHLKAEYNLSHVSPSRSPINSTTNSLLPLFEFDKLL